MTATYTYDGGDLDRIRVDSVELTQSADLGAVGSGRFTYDDTAGTQAIVGQKDFAVTEDDCANPDTFVGFIGPRTYSRKAERTGASREIEVSVDDTNAMLGFLLIDDTDGNRPAETVAARGAWLMASDYVGFADNGRCTFSASVDMGSADYRGRFAGDVLADMALAQGGVNYHVNDWGAGPELTFRDDNASTADSSAVQISNVLADVDSDFDTLGATKTFAPSTDATLTRDPSAVVSKLRYDYANGSVVEERAATAAAFNGERGGSASNSDVRSATVARTQAQSQLWQLHTENDVIECAIQVPPSAVNLLRPGERMQAKFSHLAQEGYSTFTWFRVLERTVKSLLKPSGFYELRLRLSPQEAADIPGDCVDLYPGTPSGTYYPLGGNPPGTGTPPNGSDGVVYYYRGGLEFPSVPNPGMVGGWHFSLLGVGGLGTIDYAGDCCVNRLVFMTVGNGVWTIQSEIYGGSPRALFAQLHDGSIINFNSGDSIEVTIDDATDGDCIRLVVIGDYGYACGGKWGFSQAVWVAA